MARFKFGKKKKEVFDPNSSVSTTETDDNVRHSYLRRPSVSSKQDLGSPAEHHLAEEIHRPEAGVWSEAHQEGTVSGTPWRRHKLYDSPFPRYRHTASQVSSDKNEIFLMGGLKEGSVFGDTWRIMPEIGAGNTIVGLTALHVEVVNNNNPPARVGHSSVLCGNAYIIYGGDTVDTDYNGFPDDNFYMFNINNLKYTIPLHILNKPSGRYGHLIGVVLLSQSSSRLYLFGGQLENDVFNDLYYFELTLFKLPKARWDLAEPVNNFKPPPLTNHSMAVHKTKIYIFGGVYNNEKVSRDLWCFDTVTSKWLQIETTGQEPPPVNEHTSVVVGDRLYVYGGNDFSGIIYDSLYVLDLHTLKWTLLSKELSVQGPGARCGHSMTYLPKLNKILVLGGDKNDYIYSDPNNYDTYEEFDGNEYGTMVYELDVATLENHLRGTAPKRVAASAGGAAGVLSRRAPSPLPSEDALTRHRRSMSAGPEEYKTPLGSTERLPRSLDPSKEPPVMPVSAAESTIGDRFVDVDIPSSAISERDMTSEIEDSRELPESNLHTNGRDYIPEESEFPDKVRAENNDTPLLNDDFGHLNQPFLEGDVSDDFRANSTSSPVEANTVGMSGASRDINRFEPSTVTPRDYTPKIVKIPKYGNGGLSARTSEASGSGDNSALVAKLNAELKRLKESTDSQLKMATDQISRLEQENKEARVLQAKELQEQEERHAKQAVAKDSMIEELRRSIEPADLEVNGDEDSSLSTTKRGFSLLTKYKLLHMESVNRVAHLENENALLHDKILKFEPFMNNQMVEVSSLQKIIKAQEEKIVALSSQVKLELVLLKEISDWKHKHEQLQLDFDNYRAVNGEIEISDAEDEAQIRDLDPGNSSIVSTRKSRRDISSHLEHLVGLWLTSNDPAANDAQTRDHNEVLVEQLQKQVDELMKTSQTHHASSSAEVKELEEELQNKLQSLKTFEENYRDALQSVNNTSKALNLTQEELHSQKAMIEKLVKENNELKLFKKANAKPAGVVPNNPTVDTPQGYDEDGFTSAHYNMKLKDLEADLYIMKQERDLANAAVTQLKKELYLAQNNA